MRFFLHAVKQPLLGKESKTKSKEKEEDKVARSKKPAHIGLKISFILG